MNDTPPFIHLRLHTEHSLLEGAVRIRDLAKMCTDAGMPAVAVTDTNNMFAALEFSVLAAEAGLQPIIGCTLNITFEKPGEPGTAAPHSATPDGSIALLAKDEAGYRNLMELTSRAYVVAAEVGQAFVTVAELQAYSDGLIALSGGPEGLLDNAFAEGNIELAQGRTMALHSIFEDRFYIELQRHGIAQEQSIEPHLLQLAYAMQIPLVATNEPCFAVPDEFEAHDALICIAQGSYVAIDERRRLSPEHYFKSADEMRTLFADLPEAIENTVEIARPDALIPGRFLKAELTGRRYEAVIGVPFEMLGRDGAIWAVDGDNLLRRRVIDPIFDRAGKSYVAAPEGAGQELRVTLPRSGFLSGLEVSPRLIADPGLERLAVNEVRP